ncbi:hypothetical protein Rcae01_01359 [Novipirellula caenicola]|uniref:Uncharacterized protein n=1 Tax=Novipirellula caenicola TaxID=1536901 RepID=A0ABP9VL29_9BACT
MHLTRAVAIRITRRLEDYRKMGDRKMMMLQLGAAHFSVLHFPVNPPLLDCSIKRCIARSISPQSTLQQLIVRGSNYRLKSEF